MRPHSVSAWFWCTWAPGTGESLGGGWGSGHNRFHLCAGFRAPCWVLYTLPGWLQAPWAEVFRDQKSPSPYLGVSHLVNQDSRPASMKTWEWRQERAINLVWPAGNQNSTAPASCCPWDRCPEDAEGPGIPLSFCPAPLPASCLSWTT